MKELLFSITRKDFEITWFSGTGAGGQYRNKHQNSCRIKHKETGIIRTGQSNRNRVANQKEAFNSLVKSLQFKLWLNKKIYEITEKDRIEVIDINKKVEEEMKETNLRIEYLELEDK